MKQIFKLFYPYNWGKWEHVIFVEDFRAGLKVYDILKRTCRNTNMVQYKRVYVKQCVHGLCTRLNIKNDE